MDLLIGLIFQQRETPSGHMFVWGGLDVVDDFETLAIKSEVWVTLNAAGSWSFHN